MSVAIVVLTADPVTRDADLIVVNASRAEIGALRSGEVTPDTIQVRRSDMRIEWRRVGTTDGPVLTDAQIRQAATLALTAERERGRAVEVEMALDGPRIRVVRTRSMGPGSERADEKTGTGR